jgi:hypothetical protein
MILGKKSKQRECQEKYHGFFTPGISAASISIYVLEHGSPVIMSATIPT